MRTGAKEAEDDGASLARHLHRGHVGRARRSDLGGGPRSSGAATRRGMAADLWSAVNSGVGMAELVTRLAAVDVTQLPRLAVLFFERERRPRGRPGPAPRRRPGAGRVRTDRRPRRGRVDLAGGPAGRPDPDRGGSRRRNRVARTRCRSSAVPYAPVGCGCRVAAADPATSTPPRPAGRRRGRRSPPDDPTGAADRVAHGARAGAAAESAVEPDADDRRRRSEATADDIRRPSPGDVEVMENADTELIYLPPPAVARLRAPDGSTIDLDRPVLIGRAPSDSGFENSQPHLLTVPSPSQDISRTHVLVAPEGERDRGHRSALDQRNDGGQARAGGRAGRPAVRDSRSPSRSAACSSSATRWRS